GGVWIASKKQKAATAEFTVVDKPAATKKLAQLDGDKRLHDLLRSFSKAEALQNNGLYAEALATYVAIGKSDDRINIVYGPIMECLRRLHEKNTPLLDEAKARASTPQSK